MVEEKGVYHGTYTGNWISKLIVKFRMCYASGVNRRYRDVALFVFGYMICLIRFKLLDDKKLPME